MRLLPQSLLDAATGLSLALILQTSYRFSEGLGPGEIGLAICTLIGVVNGLLLRRHSRSGSWWNSGALLLFYLVVVLLPVTVIYWAAGTIGTSFRDWAAYLLSFSFLFSLYLRQARASVIASWLLGGLVILLSYQFFFGGPQAWYEGRFTGGAKNPNQLALYAACGLSLALGCLHGAFVRWAVAGAILFFGIRALSDAFSAYLVAVAFTAVLVVVVPRKYFVPAGVPVLLIAVTVVMLFGTDLLDFGGQEWVSADEGGGRVTLYSNGLQAWLSSPFTVVLGNGAGVFSGLYGPFQLSESHNTPIDFLAMGGVLGLLVFLSVPLPMIYGLYRENMRVAFSLLVGLCVFSLFHFVARHPIFWFTLYASAWTIEMRRRGSPR